MSAGESLANPTELPRSARGVLLLVAAVIAATWLVTLWTATDYNDLLMMQLAGVAPAGAVLFVALSGVLMVAMMLPSALPMALTFRGLSLLDAGAKEARVRTAIFCAGYFVVWTVFTALSLVALAGLGLMGIMGGPAIYVPGLLLLAMGAYQLTGWKQFCLNHCRSPSSFITTHWKSGRAGAVRMGLDHAAYCLGCCWLLMLVLFVAGAMSILWASVFSVLILGEKVWSRGQLFSKGIGVMGIGAGLVTLAYLLVAR